MNRYLNNSSYNNSNDLGMAVMLRSHLDANLLPALKIQKSFPGHIGASMLSNVKVCG